MIRPPYLESETVGVEWLRVVLAGRLAKYREGDVCNEHV